MLYQFYLINSQFLRLNFNNNIFFNYKSKDNEFKRISDDHAIEEVQEIKTTKYTPFSLSPGQQVNELKIVKGLGKK